MSPLTKMLVAVGLLAGTAVSQLPICRRPGCPPGDLILSDSLVPAAFTTASLVARDQDDSDVTATEIVVVETPPPTPTTELPTTTIDTSFASSTVSTVDLDVITIELPSNSTDGTSQTMPYTAFLRQAVQAVAIASVDHALIVTGAYNGSYDISPLHDQLGKVVGLTQKFGFDYGVNRTKTCSDQVCLKNVLLNAMDVTQMTAMVQTKQVLLPTLKILGKDGIIDSFLLDLALAAQQE